MGWARFLATAGAATIITGIRADVSTLPNAREVMLTVGGVLLLLAVLAYGRSQPPPKRATASSKQE